MKKFLGFLFVLIVLATGAQNIALAETVNVNLTLRSGETIIFSGVVLFPASTTELQGQTVNSASVLAILNDADLGDDNWQYTVDGSYPGVGMDQTILAGGENVYVYFGSQYRILLDADEIDTETLLTITAQEYDYQNNEWEKRTGITAGFTQPNTDDTFP